MIEKEIIIIGGGVTGLSLASYLDNRDYILLEAENELGGYCRTIKTENFVWDYSGHFFHFRDEEIKNKLISNIECEVSEIKKISKIYHKGKYIDFPFQYNIHNLDKNEFIDCLVDLFSINKKNEYDNFKDYIYNTLGTSISEKFIIPYNQKLYSCNLDNLDFNCMKRFFPSMNFEDYMESLSGKKFSSYNDTFIYPKNGAFEFIKSITKNIPKEKLLINQKVISIDLEKKIIVTENETYAFSKLVSTIPFKKLLSITNDDSNNLNNNKVVVFNIGFDKPSENNYHWVYFSGKEIFYRVGFYDNIHSSDKMSLYVEIGMESNSTVDEKKLFNRVISDLTEVGIINEHEVIEYNMLILDPAYVHINKYSEEKYKSWSEKWNEFGIYSIGRYGSWTYCSIEDNIIQSKKISKIL
jgi:protoporphyrinogen oxidase